MAVPLRPYSVRASPGQYPEIRGFTYLRCERCGKAPVVVCHSKWHLLNTWVRVHPPIDTSRIDRHALDIAIGSSPRYEREREPPAGREWATHQLHDLVVVVTAAGGHGRVDEESCDQ